jgi:hypothetical protein
MRKEEFTHILNLRIALRKAMSSTAHYTLQLDIFTRHLRIKIGIYV